MTLNVDLQHRLSALEQFRAPFLEKQLVEKGVFGSNEDYQAAFTEFKRFVGVRMLHAKPTGIVSTQVDEIWHAFILHTREYGDFCETIVGKFMHHRFLDDSIPMEQRIQLGESFIEVYTQIYGEPPRMVDS